MNIRQEKQRNFWTIQPPLGNKDSPYGEGETEGMRRGFYDDLEGQFEDMKFCIVNTPDGKGVQDFIYIYERTSFSELVEYAEYLGYKCEIWKSV